MKWFGRITSSSHTQSQEDKADYSLLHESSDGCRSSENGVDTENFPKAKNNIYRYSILLAKGIFISLAFWGFCILARSTSSKFRRPVSCSCGGTTVAEALSRGCVFTPLALGWLPPQCLDLELSDDFDKQGPLAGGEWPYWADLNGTTRLTREEMGLLAEVGGVFYTTQEWHVMHCMYTWRKHYRSQFTGVNIERRSNGIDHIHHCEGIVLDRAPLQKIWTMAGVELNADLG
ncbi:hypothetical protein OIDMADRAFT_128271 [Oidiodendron maius Zn]|uniref:Uncharacterized protein n=1 Tax=Oidiodendron maius (strain Zn) TaxID=913774 RepID=A0A0C3CGZ3_OIDMZ|nr:hypothetical protein OIDMADRAFT_128271 [Oidiodendron maius Zn]